MEEKEQSKRSCENNSEIPRSQVLQEERPEKSEESSSSYETKKQNKTKNTDILQDYEGLKNTEKALNTNKVTFREKPGKEIEDETTSLKGLSCNEQGLRESIQNFETEAEMGSLPLIDHVKDDSNEITKQLDIDAGNNRSVVDANEINIIGKEPQHIFDVDSKGNIDNNETNHIIACSSQSTTEIECKVSESLRCIKPKLCIFCKKSFSFNFQLRKHKSKSCKPFLILQNRYKRNFFRKNICEKCGLKFRNPISLGTHRAVCYKFSKMEKKIISSELRSNLDNKKRYRKQQINDKNNPILSKVKKVQHSIVEVCSKNRKIELSQKLYLKLKSDLSHISSNAKSEPIKAEKLHLTYDTKICSTNKSENQSTTERANPNISGNKLSSGKFETTSNLENDTNGKNKSTSTGISNKALKINFVNNSNCNEIILISKLENSKHDLSGTKAYLKNLKISPIEQEGLKKPTKIGRGTDLKIISRSTSDLKSSTTDETLKTNSVSANKSIDDKTHCGNDNNIKQKLNICNNKINQVMHPKVTEPDIDYYFRSRICDICYFRFDNINALSKHKSLYCRRFNIQTKPESCLCSGSSSKVTPDNIICQKNVAGNVNLIGHNSESYKSQCSGKAIVTPKLSKKGDENQLTCNKKQMLKTKERQISQCGDLTKPNTIKAQQNVIEEKSDKTSKSEFRVPNTACDYCKTNFSSKIDLAAHKAKFCKKNISEKKHIESKKKESSLPEIKQNKVEERKSSEVTASTIKTNKLHTEVTKIKSFNISEQATKTEVSSPVLVAQKDSLQNAAKRQDKQEPKKVVDQIKNLPPVKPDAGKSIQSVQNVDGTTCYRCGSEFYYNSALKRHQSFYCKIFNVSKKTTENTKKNDKGKIVNDSKSNSAKKLENVVNASKEVPLKDNLNKTDVPVQPYKSTSDNDKAQKNVIYSSTIVKDNDEISNDIKSVSGEIPHNISSEANTMLPTENIENTRKSSKKLFHKSDTQHKISGENNKTKSKNTPDKLQAISENIENTLNRSLDKIRIEQKISETSNKSEATIDVTRNISTNTVKSPDKYLDKISIPQKTSERNKKIDMNKNVVSKSDASIDFTNDARISMKMSDKKTAQVNETNIDIAKAKKGISNIVTDKIEFKNDKISIEQKLSETSNKSHATVDVGKTGNKSTNSKKQKDILASKRETKVDTDKKVVSKTDEIIDLTDDQEISPKMSGKKTDQLKNTNVAIAKSYKQISSLVTEKIECKNKSLNNDVKEENVDLISGNNESKISKDIIEVDATISRSAKTAKNIGKKADDTKTEEEILNFSGSSSKQQKVLNSSENNNVFCTKLNPKDIASEKNEKYAILKKASETTKENIGNTTSSEPCAIITNIQPVKNVNFKEALSKIATTDKSHNTSNVQKVVNVSFKEVFKAAPLEMLENIIPAKVLTNNDPISENISEFQKKIETTQDENSFNNEIPVPQDTGVKRMAKQTITAPKSDPAEDNNICTVCGYQFEYSFALKRHTSLYCKAFNISNSKFSNKDLDTNNSKTKLDKEMSISKEVKTIKTRVDSSQEEDSENDLNIHCLEEDEDLNETTEEESMLSGAHENDRKMEIEPEEGEHVQHQIMFDLREKLNRKSDLRKKIKTKKKENEPALVNIEKSHHKVPDTILNEEGLSQKIPASMVINAKERVLPEHVVFELTETKKKSVTPENVASTCPSTFVKSEISLINKERGEKRIKVPSPTINPTATRVYNKVATFDAVKEQKPKLFCEKCGQIIRSVEDVENPPCGHRKIFFECLVCKTDFPNINSLIYHQDQMHQATEIVIKETEGNKNNLNCYHCCHCGEGFKFLTQIISHKADKHQFYKKSNTNSPAPIIRPDEQEEKVYLCIFCNDKPFTSLEKLLRHEETSKDHKQNERKFSTFKANYSPILTKKCEHVCYICNIGFRSFKKHQIHMLTSYQHYELEKNNLKNNCSPQNIEIKTSIKAVGLETNLDTKKTVTGQYGSYYPQVIEHVRSTPYYPLQAPLPSHAYSTVHPVENLPSHYFAPNQNANVYDQQSQKQYSYHNQEQSSRPYQPRPLEKPFEYPRARCNSSDDYYSKSVPIHIPSVVNKNPLNKPMKIYSTPVSIEKSDLYKKIVGALNPDLKVTSTETNIKYSKSLSKTSQLTTISKEITKPSVKNYSKSLSKTSQLTITSKEIAKHAVKTTSSTKRTSISDPRSSVKEVVSSKNLTSASNPDYQVAYTVPPIPVTTSKPILVSDDPSELNKPFVRYYDIQKHAVLSYNEFEAEERNKPGKKQKKSDDGQMNALDIYSETLVSSNGEVQFKGHKCYGCDETFNKLRDLDNHECSGPF